MDTCRIRSFKAPEVSGSVVVIHNYGVPVDSPPDVVSGVATYTMSIVKKRRFMRCTLYRED